MQPKENEFIYTDGVDYAKTADGSVWGTEEEVTSNLIGKSKINGKWLNLCAGDGRFNNQLLTRADEVTAVDIDESALQKLVRITPERLKSRLKIQVANVAKPLPFNNQSFDGIFCVGTLHLFPKQIFKEIFNEMDRVLKVGGLIIIDFAADIKRVYPDGTLWKVGNEPNYTIAEAKKFLEDVFRDYKINIHVNKSKPEDVTLNDRTYTFSCNFILLEGQKAE